MTRPITLFTGQWADLTLEELFTNLVRHAPGSDEIEIEIELEGGLLTIRLIDRETKPFDGNSLGEVDTEAPLMEREPGGLGIHLVKKMADIIDHMRAFTRSPEAKENIRVDVNASIDKALSLLQEQLRIDDI